MKEWAAIVAEIPIDGPSRLLAPPKANPLCLTLAGIIGLVLVIAWVIYSPRVRIKRFGLWFWCGLAVSSIVGPIFAGWLR